MPYLIVENGPLKGHRSELKRGSQVVFGRDAGADIVTDDSLCSRQHFVAEGRTSSFIIRDLGSSNGTYVNDNRVDEVQLKAGDTVRAGETQLTFLDDATVTGRGLTGKEVGGYRLLERIGRGGMGTVYKALQVSLNRVIALKILSARFSKNPEFVARFQREAQAAGRLNNPNIVQVYDVGSERDLHFFSMEYIENGSVQDLVNKTGPLGPDLALGILIDAARGLEYAEKKGLVHRDIKPDNLMINADGVVKIADLGLAHDLRDLDENGGPSSTDDAIYGTPHFIAPEQARGQSIDTRSDIYSLGATAYLLLTAKTPFSGKTVREIIQKQINEPPPDVRQEVSGIPAGLAHVIEKMLDKAPDNRPQNATELLQDLELVGRGAGRGLLKPLLIGALVVAVMVVAGIKILGTSENGDPTPPPVTNGAPNGPTAAELEAERVREAERLRERREKDANEAYSATYIEDLKLTLPDDRNAATLQALKQHYLVEVIEKYGDTNAAEKARVRMTAIEGEIQVLARAEADRLEAETKRKEAADQAVAAALTTATRAISEDRFGAALWILSEARHGAALSGRPEAAHLDARAIQVKQEAVKRAGLLETEASALEDKGECEQALALLEGGVTAFEADCATNQLDPVIARITGELRDAAGKARRALVARRLANLQYDQKNGFTARRAAVLALRERFDPDHSHALLTAARKSMKTAEWRQILDGDLADVVAMRSVERKIHEALSKKIDQKILMPRTSDPRRGISWTLVSLSERGFSARRIKSRPPKNFQFKDFSARIIKRWFVDEHLRLEGETVADVIRFMLYGGMATEAGKILDLLPGDLPGREALVARVKKEALAQQLLDAIRAEEPLAGEEPAANLHLKRSIERLLKKFIDTLVFICNSDGSTNLISMPARKL